MLLAYAKIDLTDEILDSDLPDDPLLEGELVRYFPTTLQQKFEPQLRSHRLRREIATLQVVNSLVNRCGPTFVRTVGQRTGAPASSIARAFAVVRDAWKLRDLWGEVEALDEPQGRGADPHAGRLAALPAARGAMDPAPPAAADRHHGRHRAARRRRGGAGRSAVLADRRGREHGAQRARRAFEALGAPPDTARRASALETLAAAGDLMLAARANGCTIEDGGAALFPAGRAAVAGAPEAAAHKLPRDGQWPAQAAVAMIDELAALHADLLGSALQDCRATRTPPCSAGARAAGSRSSGSQKPPRDFGNVLRQRIIGPRGKHGTVQRSRKSIFDRHFSGADVGPSRCLPPPRST